ncbi:MAG: 30S ribosomal protein S15 [Nanoarchaeota archaeon]|nr:30S ribosomal protein S15 [Nanoarchaeota archaeon]
MAKKKVKAEKKNIGNAELEKLILEMAKTMSPSEIGNKIKREYGVTIKAMTGKVGKLLAKNNAKQFPEDLKNVVEKMKILKAHVAKNRNDKKVSRSVHITEGRIRRLATYYKKKKVIPQDWTPK